MNFKCYNCLENLSADQCLVGQEVECPACYTLVDVPNRSVKHVARPVEKQGFSKVGPIFLIIFPVLACLCVMLPWVDLGFISASGFRKLGAGNALILMAFLALPLIGGASSLINNEPPSRSYVFFTVLTEVLAICMMIFFYTQLMENLNSTNANTRSTFLKGMNLSMGIGFPLTFVFIIATFITSLSSKRK